MEKRKHNVQRNYKDTVFRMLFEDKKELLSLYNAVNGTHYENDNELEITTLDNAVYMAMKNDVSFIFQFYLNLYEHQSTLNPNMPLRDLFYISHQLEKIVIEDTLYASSLVKIPTPRFVIFYNGKDACPERMELRLSDAFERKEEIPDLELKVLVLNINEGMNKEIIEACQTLKEYCRYVERVRKYTETMPIEEAVERTVTECIAQGILADFLKKQRAEVISMSIFEYNEEEEIKKIRESERRSARAEGELKGRAESLLEILSYHGDVSEDIKKRILEEKDVTIFKEWTKIAANSTTIEEFAKKAL